MQVILTWKDLRQHAAKDHDPWRGKAVLVKRVGVSNGQGLDEFAFEETISIMIVDEILSPKDIEQFNQKGLIDVYYPATSGKDPRLCQNVHFGGGSNMFCICWVRGPTYHLDGSVEYPSWWNQETYSIKSVTNG